MHNINLLNKSPEQTLEPRVVSLRLDTLRQAVDNSNRSSTNEPSPVTVTEVPSTPPASEVASAGSETYEEARSRRLVEDAYRSPISEEPNSAIGQMPAKIIQFPKEPDEPQTLGEILKSAQKAA